MDKKKGLRSRLAQYGDEEFALFLRLMAEHANVWSKVSCPERLSVSGPKALDGERAMWESLQAFKRAGADSIISYFARDAAKALA